MLSTKIKSVVIFPDEADTLAVATAHIVSFGEGGSAILSWQFQTNMGQVIKNGSMEMRGDDYNSWGSDDSVVLQYVAQKLGVELDPVAQAAFLAAEAAQNGSTPEEPGSTFV